MLHGMSAFRLFLMLGLIALPLSSRADWQWSRHVAPGVGAIRAIAYGGGIFVAGTSAGYMLSSRDGVTWTTVRPATLAINDLVFGHDRFVASVSSGPGMKSKILYSSNGEAWNFARRVANGGRFGSRENISALGTKSGRFIGLGGGRAAFANSVNGTRWQNPLGSRPPSKYAGSVTGLATSSGSYVLCSSLAGATIQTSHDGFAWTTRFMTSSRGPARGIAAEKPGRRAICIGENGLCLVSSNGAETWRAEPFGSMDLLGITWANKLFLSITDKTVHSTPGGLHWTRQLKLSRSGDHLRAIAGGAGLYVAAGSNGKNGLFMVSSGLPGPATAQ